MKKEKGFYISLLSGIACIAVIGAICMNMFVKPEETAENVPIAEETELVVPTPIAATAEPQKVEESTTQEASSKRVKSEVKEERPKQKATMKKVSTEDKLHFDQETGLLWPVEGDILIEYSADKLVFFPTLSQYKTNPAMIIASEVGESVKASAAGVVKSIEKNEETGTTVTMSIGDGFKVVYGQLKDVTVSQGDSVSEGQVIGKIAKPTKYYSVEGANLYYQVKQKNETVNPLVFLR
ncbi:MAG: peptidoglycan DD-metalloendopeptidase family protein [Eubacterium sp.]